MAGGRLDMLEGFTYDEAWPENITEFQVGYTPDDERDVSSLEL